MREEPGRVNSPVPHNRQVAPTSRNRSATVSEDSLVRSSSPSLYPPNRPFARHDRSQSNSSFTPPHSASTASSSTHSRKSSGNQPPPPATPAAAGHSRGASYTATQRLSGGLASKKSLPDLRLSHAQIIHDRKQDGQVVEETRPLGLGINTPTTQRFQGRSPIWDGNHSPRTPSRLTPTSQSWNMTRKGSADSPRYNAGLAGGVGDTGSKRDSNEGPLVDESRNSYFRRLNTLPVSTLSKGIPPALLKFIDAIRGILFALSQLHSVLRQYLVYAVHDRVASVFTRVMEPAGKYMNNLINALDRFDSMSRRSTPPVSAIKSVIQATKESVAVFSKVVAVLRLQMPALKNGDVRYTKTLWLMIYGSVAEIGSSWSDMAQSISDIKPLLTGEGGRSMLGGVKMVTTGSLPGRTPISPIPERGESKSPYSAARSSMSTINASPSEGRVATMEEPLVTPSAGGARMPRNRRQGGSFSTEDVEKGMLMGSPSGGEEIPLAPSGPGMMKYTRHRPSESAQVISEDPEDESEDGEEETLLPLPIAPFARSANGHGRGSGSGFGFHLRCTPHIT